MTRNLEIREIWRNMKEPTLGRNLLAVLSVRKNLAIAEIARDMRWSILVKKHRCHILWSELNKIHKPTDLRTLRFNEKPFSKQHGQRQNSKISHCACDFNTCIKWIQNVIHLHCFSAWPYTNLWVEKPQELKNVGRLKQLDVIDSIL